MDMDNSQIWFEVYAFAADHVMGDAPFFVFRSKYRQEAIAFMLHLPIDTRSHIIKIPDAYHNIIEHIPYHTNTSTKLQ